MSEPFPHGNLPRDLSGDDRLGVRLRDLRRARGLSLEQLAARSGVSRATISKVELSQTSPGTETLSKLTEALGTSFAAVMSPQSEGEIVVLRASEQPVMRDRETGLNRRCIAPILPSRGLDWVLNELPPGQSTGTFMPHRTGVEEYIFVLDGKLQAELGDTSQTLGAGDAIYFQAHVPHRFTAIGDVDCKFMVIINDTR